jgi:hypothetical protein
MEQAMEAEAPCGGQGYTGIFLASYIFEGLEHGACVCALFNHGDASLEYDTKKIWYEDKMGKGVTG